MLASDPLHSWRVEHAPHYHPQGDEVALFEAAYAARLPVMIKGPTGCGKSRFVEHMAWKLGRPLVTVACNEDMTAADLVGRFLLEAGGTRWQDGPLTLAARHGAICYLDEVVEARQDTTVVIHPLTDPPPHPAARQEGRVGAGAPGLPAGDFVQPRLPESDEGLEDLDEAALCGAGFRLPGGCTGGGHRRRRDRPGARAGCGRWWKWRQPHAASRATAWPKGRRRGWWCTRPNSCAKAWARARPV